MGIRRVILKTDSQVNSGHMDKSSKARDPKLENIWMKSKNWKLLLRDFL
jgi:hypothetical protein